MLTYACKTAIKAVIYLSSKTKGDEKTSISDISEHLNISAHTLGKVLQTLAKRGIVNSTRGPMGGFFTTDEQRLQPIMDIVVAMDGERVFKQCGMGLSQCSEHRPCPIHDQYKKLRDDMTTLFQNNKIIDLCHSVNKGVAYLFD